MLVFLLSIIISCKILKNPKSPTIGLTKFYKTKLNDLSTIDSFILKSEQDYCLYNFAGARFDTMTKFIKPNTPFYYIKICMDKEKLHGYLYQYRKENDYERLITKCPIINGKLKGLCENYTLLGAEVLSDICEYANSERNGMCLILSTKSDFLLVRQYKNDKLQGKSILIHDLKDIVFYREYNNGKVINAIMELYPGRYE